MVNVENYKKIINELGDKVTLVAVSKTKPVEDIKELYDLGHRDFGENYVQEMEDKYEKLPKDIHWHFIGHLQSNKVKQVAAFVQLIHGVDSLKLLKEINKLAEKNNRIIDCLLQIHIAEEETKFGLDEKELEELLKQSADAPLHNVRVIGLMGMASFTSDMNKVRSEFKYLKTLFNQFTTHDLPTGQAGSRPAFRTGRLTTLSMGMSSDYKIAIEEGSNMVRIGSLIFGDRK